MKYLYHLLFIGLLFTGKTCLIWAQDWSGDTLMIQAVTFETPSPSGWNAQYTSMVNFPEGQTEWRQILMIQTLICDSATAGDKYPCGEWDYIWNHQLAVPRGDTTEIFSIASFVTPYGKRLKLGGEKGWTWTYDITEYAPLLTGPRELITGNNQELLDLKFLFIKGTPARKILSVENLYPQGDYTYESLANDSLLKERKVVLSDNAKAFRLKAVISGHGHEGPRNCCEWDSKTHSYYINTWEVYRWNVWTDCGNNPIYPQGGTWPFDRAGWCPGAPVDEYEFEITDRVNPGDTILFDYGIENYQDNGEKQGHFRMTHQLFSYGPPNFNLDASLVDILIPSTNQNYSRMNPSCSAPLIRVRNEGRDPIKQLEIVYGLEGKRKQQFIWKGDLSFLEEVEIQLPELPWRKIKRSGSFQVEIRSVNTKQDENPANDRSISTYNKPLVLPKTFILNIESNNLNRARENAYRISDSDGMIWYYGDELADSSSYRIPIQLEKGCYEFLFSDKMEDGISKHWWYRGSNPDLIGIDGQVQIESSAGDTLISFPADFGQELLLNFMVE